MKISRNKNTILNIINDIAADSTEKERVEYAKEIIANMLHDKSLKNVREFLNELLRY